MENLTVLSLPKGQNRKFLFKCSRWSYLVWIDLNPLGIDDRALQKALIEQQKVAIMPGYTYGEEGNGFVRLNAGCPRVKLEQGVQRLIAAIRSLS